VSDDPYEVPAPEAPVDGAELAELHDLDWDRAVMLVDALMAAAGKVGDHLEARPGMVSGMSPESLWGIRDWDGPFRDEYDEALETLTTETEGLRVELLDVALAIVDSAHDVNEEQFDLNNAVEEV
jgi:hypothetical protein